jgi:hypothetical protein
LQLFCALLLFQRFYVLLLLSMFANMYIVYGVDANNKKIPWYKFNYAFVQDLDITNCYRMQLLKRHRKKNQYSQNFVRLLLFLYPCWWCADIHNSHTYFRRQAICRYLIKSPSSFPHFTRTKLLSQRNTLRLRSSPADQRGKINNRLINWVPWLVWRGKPHYSRTPRLHELIGVCVLSLSLSVRRAFARAVCNLANATQQVQVAQAKLSN